MMETEKSLLSQKEYLKRYLSKDKKKKKKKQNKISSSSHVKRSVIIDDDLGLRDVATVDDEEFNLDYLGDEAPQIAGIVDERPDELKAKEKYSNNLWSSVGDGNTDNDSKQCGKNNSVLPKANPPNCDNNDDSDSDLSLPRPGKREVDEYKVNNSRKSNDENNKKMQKKKSKETISSDSDLSPDRRSKKHGHSDSDMSPPRSSKSRKYDKETYSYGLKHKNSNSTNKYSVYPKKHEKIDKYSKDKRAKHIDEDSGSDSTLKERRRRDKHKQNVEKENRNKREDVRSRHKSFYGNEAVDSYRHRNNEKHQKYGGSTSNSSRKYSEVDSKKRNEPSSDKFRIVGNRDDSDSDLSPARCNAKKAKSHSRDLAEEKMLDGKKSGLQDAKHLKEELKRLKENEDKLFKKMDPSLLGANAAPIQRDRKTGQVRLIEKEREEEKAKADKRAKTENKYYKWGKGLKQMQDQEERIADALHEMSKPLARYRDDKDLDAYLRAQEREGDPMLDYIKSKQAESHNVIDLTVGSTKPRYNGSFMPNRFGIVPGYRWDGVDRSNGYEKKWFEQKNARKAVDEEAYKWSTSDM